MDKARVSALGDEFDLPLATMGLPNLGPARRLGEILAEQLGLTPEQVQAIQDHAAARGLRFGDAAVALGEATEAEVVQALSEQFLYAGIDVPEARRPVSDELVMLVHPHAPPAEALRALRSQLMRRAFRHDAPRHALAIVSPDPGDGKTWLVANLAVSLAQAGGRTLVVDADLRGPRMHEVFGLSRASGLSSVLAGRADMQLIQPVSGVAGLFVLAGGAVPPNPLELIERRAFGSLMEMLPRHFDHVLVDTPAATYGADALAIADRCGKALLVGRRHRSRMQSLNALASELGEVPERLVGVVVNEF